MRRFAEIKSGVVRAIATGPDDWTPEFSPASGLTAVAIPDGQNVSGGWTYDGSVFSSPAETAAATPTAEQARESFEAERKRLFNETAWVRERHADFLEMGITDANWTTWLNYWQALRDLPNDDGFDPADPQWPKMPE